MDAFEEIGRLFRVLLFERDKWQQGEMPNFKERAMNMAFQSIVSGLAISDKQYIDSTLTRRRNGEKSTMASRGGQPLAGVDDSAPPPSAPYTNTDTHTSTHTSNHTHIDTSTQSSQRGKKKGMKKPTFARTV